MARNVKVKIYGHEFWFRESDNGDGPISPLFHCDENGNLDLRTCFSTETFAHVKNGEVLKHGRVIGTKEQLLNGEL